MYTGREASSRWLVVTAFSCYTLVLEGFSEGLLNI